MSNPNKYKSKDQQNDKVKGQLQSHIANSNQSVAKEGVQNDQPIQPKISSSKNKNAKDFDSYGNQFMEHDNQQLIISKNKMNTSNKKIMVRKRIQTEPNSENIHSVILKKQLFLPSLQNRKQLKRQNIKTQSIVKLKDLYQKKIKLQRRLKILSKELLQLKVSLSINEECPKNPQIMTSQLEQQRQYAQMRGRYQSKSYSNSRNRKYQIQKRLLCSKNKKDNSPESIQSVQKNREVINFIQKMHEQSVERDLKRIKRNKKYMEHELNHVCIDCSKSKCQMQAYGSILANSRIS